MSSPGALDIRLPIGALFGVLGLVLTGYGIATGNSSTTGVNPHALPVNVNFWWGLVMLAFGVGLLLSATFYGKESVRPAQETPAGRATEAREHRSGLES
jgi:hypothetical protein